MSVYRTMVVFCFLILVGKAHSQQIRKHKSGGRIDSLINDSQSAGYNWCGYKPLINNVEVKHCGTPSVQYERDDTIYISECGIQATCDQPPPVKNYQAVFRTNIVYPAEEKQNSIQGDCLVYLRVNTMGEVDSLWVERTATATFQKAVMLDLKSFPKATPARYKGRPVEAICCYKISFRLI